MPSKRKRSRKPTEDIEPHCKEVIFVAVTTTRLGTKMRTRPVRKSSMASPSKRRMLDCSREAFTASNTPSTQSQFDFPDGPAFDYSPEFVVGSSSSPSKHKRSGKASQRSCSF